MTAAHLHAHASGSFAASVVMWEAMMIGMMAPVVWPWLRAYSRVDERPFAAALFGAGYATTWLAFSIGAAGFQIACAAAGVFAGGALTGAPLRAAVLAGAGVYQVAPLKRACLTHCRNPLTYFLTRWRGGPAGGFRMGVAHGTFCLGCCWALMLTAFSLGVMNLAWMAALAAVAFVEQVVPRGDLLRVPLGAALIGAGLLVALG